MMTAVVGQTQQLVLRAFTSSKIEALEGTDGGDSPFFSPDGQWIGFTSSDHKLKKLALDGGQVTTLAEGEWGGGSWGEDGSIVYTPYYDLGLWQAARSFSWRAQSFLARPCARRKGGDLHEFPLTVERVADRAVFDRQWRTAGFGRECDFRPIPGQRSPGICQRQNFVRRTLRQKTSRGHRCAGGSSRCRAAN